MTFSHDPHPAPPAEKLLTSVLSQEAPSRARLAVRACLTLALLAVFFVWALPALTGANWTEIGAALATVSLPELSLLLLLALATPLAYSLTIRAGFGLTYPQAFRQQAGASALAVALPMGSVFALFYTVVILRPLGKLRIATGIIMTSLADLCITALLPLLGLAALALGGNPQLQGGVTFAALVFALLTLLLVGVLSAAVFSRRCFTALARLADAGADNQKNSSALLSAREHAYATVQGRLPELFAGPLLVRVAEFVMFWLCLHIYGVAPDPFTLLAVFSLGRLLALVPLTPHGLGFSETGTAAALVALGFAPATAVAALLLFALVNLGVQVLLGGIVGAATGLRPVVKN
ncbi:lysylphosphatidylglycerol synthase domain-containing protein [Dermabacteraceae bacterium P13088]